MKFQAILTPPPDIYHYPFLEKSLFKTLLQLEDFIGVIKVRVTVIGKWIFTVILLLQLLSLVTIWTTIALTIIRKGNELLQMSIEIQWFLKQRKHNFCAEVKICKLCIII